MRVDPGLIEQHIRPEGGKNFFQRRFENRKIMLVPNSVRQSDIAG